MEQGGEIPVILMPSNIQNEIEILLSPGSRLHDICDLAGALQFSIEEINYIVEEKHYFRYLMQSWYHRDSQAATLQNLKKIIHEELRLLDIEELVQNAILELSTSQLENLDHLVKERFEQLQNFDKTLCMSETNQQPTGHERAENNNKVFIFYIEEDKDHLEKVVEFARTLREYGINSQLDVTNSKTVNANKQFYILSNLESAKYVLLVCSKSFKEVDNRMNKIIKSNNEHFKELLFVRRQILNDIYNQPANVNKYIPILLPSNKESYVPKYLKCSKIYHMPEHKQNLCRRIFQFEKHIYTKIAKDSMKEFQPKLC